MNPPNPPIYLYSTDLFGNCTYYCMDPDFEWEQQKDEILRSCAAGEDFEPEDVRSNFMACFQSVDFTDPTKLHSYLWPPSSETDPDSREEVVNALYSAVRENTSREAYDLYSEWLWDERERHRENGNYHLAIECTDTWKTITSICSTYHA